MRTLKVKKIQFDLLKFTRGRFLELERFQGYKVIHAPSLVRLNGYMFAVAALELKVVIVDDHFMTAPKNVQEFILLHEVGHLNDEGLDINAEHLANRIASVGSIPAEEKYADEYSFRRMNKTQAINALRYLKLTQQVMWADTTEVGLRIEHLESLTVKRRVKSFIQTLSLKFNDIIKEVLV